MLPAVMRETRSRAASCRGCGEVERYATRLISRDVFAGSRCFFDNFASIPPRGQQRCWRGAPVEATARVSMPRRFNTSTPNGRARCSPALYADMEPWSTAEKQTR